GCTFCENDSFSPNLKKEKNKFKLNPRVSENPNLDLQLKQLKMQFDATKARLSKKFGAKKFLVYFQSFTNTYAPMDTLRALYEKALSFDDVIGLSIGTRTDSVTDEILDYLVELSQRKIPKEILSPQMTQDSYEIWVEYGIQSFYDDTLSKINRGHDSQSMIKWIKKTKEKGLLVCGHLIFGLPDETPKMMLLNNKKTIELGIDSIKYHPLYVVKNTLLTRDFKNGFFTPIDEQTYIDTVVQSIKELPKTISVQRVTAGIDDKTLLSPMWCKNKHQQINKIKKALADIGLNY
ncbi:MAG: TIGR01212 family radical SAM protein, partial [Sphaerochaetaceae bacterium]|nr:TIGR01212 family radical SAM protein [Sphaerochaetaceae bacterium]